MPEKLFESALEQTEDALKENGTSVSLSEKNYADELERMIASQSGITVMAWKSAKEIWMPLNSIRMDCCRIPMAWKKQVKVLLNCRMVWMN